MAKRIRLLIFLTLKYTMNTKRLLPLLLTALLSACSDSEPAPKAAVSQPEAASAAYAYRPNPAWPTYLVGSELSYPPFEFKDKQSQPTGFEVELLQAVAQKEQFNVQFLDHKRSAAADTLGSGKFAIWASALSHTPDRQAAMDLSRPFLDIRMAAAVADNEQGRTIGSLADLRGKKIALSRQSSKATVEQAAALTGSADNVILSGSFYLALREVHLDKAAAAIGDSRVLAHYKLQNPAMSFRSLPLPDTRKDLVFAVKKGNRELMDKINRGLDKVKADGTYDKLVQKWFGKE